MKLLRWIITLAYAGVIFYLSSRTWPGAPSFPLADKSYHAILFFGFGSLLVWSLRTTMLRESSYLSLIAFTITILYGLSDEIHQIFVPGREFSLFDLLADSIGSIIGIFVVQKISKHYYASNVREKIS